MEFVDALKLLAEKRPEMFVISSHREFGKRHVTQEDVALEMFSFENQEVGRLAYWSTVDGVISPIACTQDDLDQIAALLGWEWHVQWFDLSAMWIYEIWRKGTEDRRTSCDLDTFVHYKTKLEAAKAALIAIIQEECK